MLTIEKIVEVIDCVRLQSNDGLWKEACDALEDALKTADAPKDTFRAGSWTLNPVRREAKHDDGRYAHLTGTELGYVMMLVRNPGMSTLVKRCIGRLSSDVAYASFNTNVRSSIKRIRRKLGADCNILAQHGAGYLYVPPQTGPKPWTTTMNPDNADELARKIVGVQMRPFTILVPDSRRRWRTCMKEIWRKLIKRWREGSYKHVDWNAAIKKGWETRRCAQSL